jgi:YHS domain-containing protein
MAVDPSSTGPRLSFEERDVAFCSTECLRRFAAHPERYA